MNQLIIGAVMVAALAGSGLYIKALRAEQATLTYERDEALQTINAMQQGLNALNELNQNNQRAQTQLRQRITQVNASMADRDQTIARLEDENEALKLWSNAPLPDDVVGLQQHPAFTGAEDYEQWLSGRDPLHPASEQGQEQRRTAQSPR